MNVGQVTMKISVSKCEECPFVRREPTHERESFCGIKGVKKGRFDVDQSEWIVEDVNLMPKWCPVKKGPVEVRMK